MRYLFPFLVCLTATTVSLARASEPAPESLSLQIARSTAYLVAHCNKEGVFAYLRHKDPEQSPRRQYNLLRHAGAMYALTMAYKRKPLPPVLQALERSSGFLQRHVRKVQRAPLTLAVWSPPSARAPDKPPIPQAKLGGTALALLAFSQYNRLREKAMPRTVLRGLGEFILFMQQKDGSFYSKYYDLGGKGCFDPWVSLYYPGEAILALLALYEIDKDSRWLEGAVKGLMYLVESRKEKTDLPDDHWALIATARLQHHLPASGLDTISQAAIFDHAARIAGQMLAGQVPNGPLTGSFRVDGTTCPTATRLEGLLALASVLPQAREALRQKILQSSHRGIAWLSSQQVTRGPLRGGFPRAAAPLPDTESNKSFNQRVNEIRIDYVQHALSALIQYEALQAAAD